MKIPYNLYAKGGGNATSLQPLCGTPNIDSCIQKQDSQHLLQNSQLGHWVATFHLARIYYLARYIRLDSHVREIPSYRNVPIIGDTIGLYMPATTTGYSWNVPSLNQLAECIETESNVYDSHTSKFSDADVHRTESTHVAASISSV